MSTQAPTTALVVAHPDDEVLWFSSIVPEVSEIIVAFCDDTQHPPLGPNRRAAVTELPYKISLLEIVSSDSLRATNWREPRETAFGVNLLSDTPPEISEHYEANYQRLYTQLSERLRGVDLVYTHNPWGEYGHAEHVQVYRAVNTLADELGFSVRVNNYASQWSLPRLLTYCNGFVPDTAYDTRVTDRKLLSQVQAIYSRHDAWTWPDEWGDWFSQETFILAETLHTSEKQPNGQLCPINFLKLRDDQFPGFACDSPRPSPR